MPRRDPPDPGTRTLRAHEADESERRFAEPANAPLLDDLFEPRIRVDASPIQFSYSDLLEGEAKLVASAIESRQREFSTGRVLARRLLRQMNVADFELLRDEDRVPKWPVGIVGSISHTGNLCAVAIAPESEYRGIGLDVEPDRPVGPGIEGRVCTPLEVAWLETGPTADRGQRCRMIFSIKEAVYKAFYPRLRESWGFRDVSVELDLAAQRFTAKAPPSSGSARVEGRLLRRAGWIISGIAIR